MLSRNNKDERKDYLPPSEIPTLWDDFNVLFNQYPDLADMEDRDKAYEEFARRQLFREHFWFTQDQNKLEIKRGLETLNKPPYNLSYRKLMFHNSKYIVGLASATDPSLNDGHKEETATTTSASAAKHHWPIPPSKELCDAWQFEGVNECLDLDPSKPQLFHTFDTVTNDDNNDEDKKHEDRQIETHPKTKALLEFLANTTKPPCYKYGQLFVGKFDDINSNEIMWDVNLPTKLPYHVQCTGIAEPGFEHIMISVNNRLLSVWNLATPELGPILQIELKGSQCKTKAIADLVATSQYVAILDGLDHLTILPWTFDGKSAVIQQEDSAKMISLWVPTVFSLGSNVERPNILYVGTKHGFVHELKLANDTLEHLYTYYTRRPLSVQFIQGRGHRVVCGSSHFIFAFNNNPNDSDHQLRMETDSGHLMGLRNIQFQGNVILFETNNRHLNIINTVTKSQRILPSDLGAFRHNDPKQEEYYERLRESSFSIMVWDNARAVIRVAYKNLTTETWNVCLNQYK